MCIVVVFKEKENDLPLKETQVSREKPTAAGEGQIIQVKDKHYSFVALAKGLFSRDDTWAFVKSNWDYFYNMYVD